MPILKIASLGLLALLLLPICVGVLYQFISTKLDEKRYPPPGKMVDIGGYRLHIHCMGKEGPLVILDSGMGSNSLDWTFVQPEIAKFTRVCSYDRAGNGWSDPSPLDRTSLSIVDELHTLLKNANIPEPYILVGHSFGGMNVRLYASKYPSEVARIVLVDSTHESLCQKISHWPRNVFQKLLVNPHIVPFFAFIGYFRILNHSQKYQDTLTVFPADIRNMYIAERSTTKYIRTVTKESANIEISAEQLREAENLGNIPLIVITAGKPLTTQKTGQSQEFLDEFAKIWNQSQKDLATKSTNGKQIFAEHSGHMIPWQQPEIIIQTVQELVKEVR